MKVLIKLCKYHLNYFLLNFAIPIKNKAELIKFKIYK